MVNLKNSYYRYSLRVLGMAAIHCLIYLFLLFVDVVLSTNLGILINYVIFSFLTSLTEYYIIYFENKYLFSFLFSYFIKLNFLKKYLVI